MNKKVKKTYKHEQILRNQAIIDLRKSNKSVYTLNTLMAIFDRSKSTVRQILRREALVK